MDLKNEIWGIDTMLIEQESIKLRKVRITVSG